MLLRFSCLYCITAYILAAPLTDEVALKRQQSTVIPIISLSAEYVTDGKFKYSYETGNGIKREETAYDKESPEGKSHSDSSNEGGEDDDSDEIHVQKGSYSYTAPDGTVVSVRYIADENGFQPIITEVSRNGTQLSGETSQNIEQSNHLKMAEYKTTNSAETEHKISSDDNITPTVTSQSKTSPKTSRKIEPVNQDNEEKTPLKYGDKLVKKSGKLSKENGKLLKPNDTFTGENANNTEIPYEKRQDSTKSLGPVDKEKPDNKEENILHEEENPLLSVKNHVSEGNKDDDDNKVSETKTETPNTVEKQNTDIINKPESKKNISVKKESENDIKKPSHNKMESKSENKTGQNDEIPDQGEETSDEPVENEANSTNGKINIDNKYGNGGKAPNKLNTTSENTKPVPSHEALVFENEPNITNHQNEILNNTKNVPEKSHESKHTPINNKEGSLKPLDNTGQSPGNKESKPAVVKKTSMSDKKPTERKSQEAAVKPTKNEANTTNADENSGNKKTLPENKLIDNKDKIPETVKATPIKENEQPTKNELNFTNESNVPKTNVETLNNTTDMPEKITENPHENGNMNLGTEKRPLKSGTPSGIKKEKSDTKNQTPENKEMKPEITDENAYNNPDSPFKEDKNNESNKEAEKQRENLVNSMQNLKSENNEYHPNKANTENENRNKVSKNLPEKALKSDKNMNNNSDNSDKDNKEKKDTEALNHLHKMEYMNESSEHEPHPKEETIRNALTKPVNENPLKETEKNKLLPNKEVSQVNKQDNIPMKNKTLQNKENHINKTEKPTPLSEPKDVIKEVQKPVKEAEKHEEVAQNAAKEAVKSAEVAANAADAAQKAAKETEEIAKTVDKPGNQSRQSLIDAAIKHAKLAGEAAKKAIEAAEMAENAAENAKNAAKAAENVVKIVQSSPSTKNLKELSDKAGKALLDAKVSANEAINAAKDATKHSESLLDDKKTNDNSRV